MARLPILGSDDGTWGEVLNEYLDVAHNSDGSLKTSAIADSLSPSDISASRGLRVLAAVPGLNEFGGSYNADVWTAEALSQIPTSGDSRLVAILGDDPNDLLGSESNGLFEHTGDGIFQRVRSWSADDAGLIISAELDNTGEGNTVVWFHSTDLTTLRYSRIRSGDADISSIESTVSDLETRLNRYYPPNPVKPHLHVSKYVTFDPDFPIDGSATYIGGQLIEDGQNVTILNDASGNGGVWTLSTSGPATRAQGFGAMVSSEIGNYDHVTYTGTRWAYFCLFRLYGDPTELGLAPVPPDNSGVFGGEGVNRSYRPDLVATTLNGDTLTVLNADGGTTDISISSDLASSRICILVLDTLSMVSVNDGSIMITENFQSADGVWIAQGAVSVGLNTIVATNGHGGHSVLSVAPDVKARLDDFETRISNLETP